jgi:hypothetical protein
METVTILRELSRHRLLVCLAAAAAILVGMLLSFKPSLPPQSRAYEVGVASARILVDTPRTQLVEVAPRGSEALGARASLLSALMTEGQVKAEIARRAGLEPKQLIASAEAEPTEMPTAGKPPSELNLLTTRLVTAVSGESLPMIEIEAQAPDAAQAGRLAGAAVTGLGAYLDSKAATEKVPDARRLSVAGLGAPQASTVVRGPRRLVALAVALFIFVAGCAAIVLFKALQRNWRAASQEEMYGDEPHGSGSLLDGAFGGPSLDLPVTPLRRRDRDEAEAKSA